MPDSIFHPTNDAALALLRQKIEAMYDAEPDARQEAVEAAEHTYPSSKHQQYMNQLQNSGASMADIQTAWHAYYSALPDHEKHEVWQEFYSTQQPVPAQPQAQQPPAQSQPTYQPAPTSSQAIQPVQPQVLPAAESTYGLAETSAAKPASPVKAELRQRAQARSVKKKLLHTVKTAAAGNQKLTVKHHLHSLAFGLGVGAITIFIFLFGFFNEVIITPFLQPSRKTNDTPVIVDTASVAVSGNKVLIPKINLEIPVDYSQTTTKESEIELALDNGIVHYPSTVKPGQTGNAAFFGHSSNNIFNPGKYKFAFAFLHELQEGDTFYLSKDGTTYAYKVFLKHVVAPQQTEVLNAIAGHPATATLITCDPPGTSINRLVVVGDQISPDPNSNSQSDIPQTQTAAGTSTTASGLPGNGPSLWSRIVQSVF